MSTEDKRPLHKFIVQKDDIVQTPRGKFCNGYGCDVEVVVCRLPRQPDGVYTECVVCRVPQLLKTEELMCDECATLCDKYWQDAEGWVEHEVINTGDAYVVEHENKVTLLTACADLTDFLGYIYELPDGREVVHGQAILWRVNCDKIGYLWSSHNSCVSTGPIRPKAVRLRLQNVGT
jgi:hypothetical protein